MFKVYINLGPKDRKRAIKIQRFSDIKLSLTQNKLIIFLISNF
jgi:hypothetical protein